MFFLLLSFLNNSLFAYPQDSFLSEKLSAEYREVIEKTEVGKNFYCEFDSIRKKRFPKILLRHFSQSGLAYYILGKDTIYLNTKYVSEFFGIKGYSDHKIIKVLNTDARVRKELVSYSDGIYFHELIHSLQDAKYGKSRYIKEGGLFLEFEYEAYLLGDIYFHEKMKANRKFFKDLLSGKYWDVYTNSELDGYLSATAAPSKYKEEIRERYLREMQGYGDIESEEMKRKVRLEESKLLYMAGGMDFKKDEKALKELEKHKLEYGKFLNDFYDKKLPVFGPEAFYYILEVSTEAGNFPLALEISSQAEKDIASYKLSPEGEKKMKTACALVFLQASSNLIDRKSKMSRKDLFANIYALDRAANLTGREFPKELYEERKILYKDKIKEILKESSIKSKKDSESDKWKDEMLKFLINSLSQNYGLVEKDL